MYCSGEDYQEVDEVALRLRMDYCHFEKRLDVFKLAEQLNMILIKYSSLTKEQLSAILSKEELKDGFTVIKKCNGEYKFYSRFNQGVVTINLVDVALSAKNEYNNETEYSLQSPHLLYLPVFHHNLQYRLNIFYMYEYWCRDFHE